MATIPPDFIDPAAPPRARGHFIVQKWRNKFVLRRWQRRGGPRDPRLRNWQRAQFGIAASMSSSPWSIDLATAIQIVKGTQMIPRDFLMMNCYARGYVVEAPDGTIWPVIDHGPPPLPTPEQVEPMLQGYVQLNPAGSAAQSNGYIRLNPVVLPKGMIVTAIQTPAASVVGTTQNVPCIYTNSGGVANALVVGGPAVTGVTVGINTFPLDAPFEVPATEIYWLGAQCNVASYLTMQTAFNIRRAYAAHTGALPSTAPAMTVGLATDAIFWATNET